MLNKISGYGPIKPGSTVKNRSGVSGASSFADLLATAGADDAGGISPLSDVNAAASIAGMLSLQEVSEEEVRRKKMLKRGNDMLDMLENLRRRLIDGLVPAHMLRELNNQLSVQKQNISDPTLQSLLDDIELRVAVELAKLEMAAQKGFE